MSHLLSFSVTSPISAISAYLVTHPSVLFVVAMITGIVAMAAGKWIFGYVSPQVDAEARARTWEDKFLVSEAALEGAKKDIALFQRAIDDYSKERWETIEARDLAVSERNAAEAALADFRDLQEKFADKVWVDLDDFQAKDAECEELRKDRDALAEWYNAEFEEVQRLKREMSETEEFIEELCADYEAEKSEDQSLITALKANVEEKEKVIATLKTPENLEKAETALGSLPGGQSVYVDKDGNFTISAPATAPAWINSWPYAYYINTTSAGAADNMGYLGNVYAVG